MTKIDAAARHRATPVRSNPLQGLSKAVSANAGTIGRQAAVLAAASGVVLTFGLPAQGAPAQDASREALTVDKPTTIALDRVSGSKPIKITATAKKNKVKRDQVSTTSEPRPEPVVEEQPESTQQEQTPAAQTNTQTRNQNQTAQAPQQRNTGQTQQQNQTQQQSQTSAASTATPKAEAKAPAGASGIVASAYAGVGSPYVLGGGTPSGWDCSGFTAWVYAQNGISIPRTTWGIMGSSKFQRVSSPAPGDLVIQNGGGHVVVYVGGGKAIGAQNRNVGTIVQSVNRNPIVGYYRYVG